MTFKVKDGISIAGTTFVDGSRNVSASTISAETVTLTGELRGPASFVIDPAGIGDNTGTVVIKGNLQIDGTTTTINSTTISVDDLNLTLADGAANAAAANGAGITISGAGATFNYASSGDKWQANKSIETSSQLISTVATGTAPLVITSTTTVSNLNADLLDGQHGSYYAPNASLSNYLALAGGTMTGSINLNNFDLSGVSKLTINDPGPTEGIEFAGGNTWRIYESDNALTSELAGNLHVVQSATRRATFNTSGQLDIPIATGTAPLVIASTTRVANLNVATAGTADTLTTARTINGVSFNGSANITVTANTTNALTVGTGLSGTSFNGSAAVTIAIDSTVATLTGTQTLTNKTIAAGSNTISGLTNSNLSGTAGITNANLANSSVTVGTTAIVLGASSTTLAGLTSVTSTSFVGALTGNASTATTLQTARNINGTSFNGSADITTGNWGAARTITIGATGKSVNGSTNVSWTLDELQAEYRQPINTARNNLGDPTSREMALYHGQFNNKFRFIAPTSQEESADGTNWTTSTRATANQLADIMLGEGQTGGFAAIPTGTVGTFGGYRLTWDVVGQTGYVFLNNLYFYNSANGNNVTVLIEAFHNTNGYVTITGPHIFSNWPGHVHVPHSVIPYSAAAAQYSRVRVTFTTTHNANTNQFDLNAIEWFGGYPAGKRNVESYDRLKNVTFPANINTPSQLVSTVATGTSPLAITSTTRVANLNVATAGTADTATTATSSPTLTFSPTTSAPVDSLQYLNTNGTITDSPTIDWWNVIRMGHGNPNTYYNNTLAMKMTGTDTGSLWGRTRVGGVAGTWFRFFDDNYHPNADTLTTARTINGTSFNGSADITITAANPNALTIGTGLSGTSYIGSSAVTIALASGYGDTQNPYASKTANFVLAAPNGSAGAPTFRALVAADIPSLDAAKITSGTIDAARLPSYVDDVLEFANLAAFPVTGETGKIYVALDTNKTYRWSGSTYVQITSGAVDSVAGKTGVVTLVKGDVGLGSVDNTADSAKSVASAATLTTARTINGVSFNGSANITVADSTKLPLTGGTLTGAVYARGAFGMFGNVAGNPLMYDVQDQAGATVLEIGRADNVAATTAMDIHTGAVSNDYDTRLEFTGGNGTPGNGTLNIRAASLLQNSIALVTTSGTQTLTNKTLTAPTINGNVTTTGINFDTNTLVIDATNNRVGIGSASPAVSLAINSTDAVLLPKGTVAQRPTGVSGYLRYNTETNTFEGHNGTVWGAIGGGGGSITVSDNAPASPTAGALWWDSSIGRLKIYYNDGDTAQWVDATPTPSSVGISAVSDTAPTALANGLLWWDSVQGALKVYYNDGNTSQWVDANPAIQGAEGPQGVRGVQGPAGADGDVTRGRAVAIAMIFG